MSGLDLGTATVADFRPYVGEPFAIVVDGVDGLSLVLAEAVELPVVGEVGREPFKLTFTGPAEPLLAQQVVPLAHERLGRFDPFLVPVGRDADGATYEAVFS
jgi:hypothetical protein